MADPTGSTEELVAPPGHPAPADPGRDISAPASALARIKEHEILQWALGYVGAAIAIAHGQELSNKRRWLFTANLLDGKDGTSRWSEHYDGDDVFALQKRIVADVAQAVGAEAEDEVARARALRVAGLRVTSLPRSWEEARKVWPQRPDGRLE